MDMTRNVSEYLEISAQENLTNAPIFLAHIYYPVAIIDLDMNERSFEDFAPIEETVLKCLNLGFSTIESMANLLGLPKHYIKKHYENLRAKGQIDDDGCLTENAIRSLEEGRAIVPNNNVKQSFQIDGVTGELLPKNLTRRPSRRISPQKINSKFFILKSIEEIDCDYLEKLITSDDFLSKYKGKNLNKNIIKINKVEFKNLFYTQAFLICSEEEASVYFTVFDDNWHGFVKKTILSPSRVETIKEYLGEMSLENEEILNFMENFAFIIHDINNIVIQRYKICKVYIEDIKKDAKLTLEDLEILVAGANPTIPITLERKIDNKMTLFSFTPILSDFLLPIAEKLREKWNSSNFSFFKSILKEQENPKEVLERIIKEENGQTK